MTVYLLHFETKYHHAQHYLGFTELEPEQRLERHVTRTEQPLLRAVVNAGINIEIARTWEGADRHFERRLKKRKKARALCPLCQ